MMPYYKIRTVEWIQKQGFYWAFQADSPEEAKKQIESGEVIPSELFTVSDYNRPAKDVQIIEMIDVTKRVEEIIADNQLCEKGKENHG